jgi:hypothetical protein
LRANSVRDVCNVHEYDVDDIVTTHADAVNGWWPTPRRAFVRLHLLHCDSRSGTRAARRFAMQTQHKHRGFCYFARTPRRDPAREMVGRPSVAPR